ncbi:MAG: recombinase family protein, partial [Kiritimatiellae bacterium]|nr:recombinase family protein [Kiritimatiellia bacterium]
MKVFLYARKSTDDEERQILSIDAQLNELREFAAKQSLSIAREFVESMTAKQPGRPIFNDMLRGVERGEADALLAWHPDRLARNSIDGGRIIYLLDTGKLTALKFPTFWFENTPQGKFVLNMAFGQSKYYVDALSENVRRGMREKIRRGVYPHKPPLGYLNEPRLRTIEIHQQKAPLVRRLFETYATGRYNFDQMTDLAAKWGLLSHQERPLARSMIPKILADRFYVGLFDWAGEEYEGTHERFIPQELFDLVQKVLADRGRGRYQTKKQRQPLAFLGLVRCDECGASVTAERQKGHHYYRCTKKLGPCDLRGYVREETLADSMRDEIRRVSISDEWAELMLAQLEVWRRDETDRATAEAQRFKDQLAELDKRVNRLLDVFLDGSITREDYAGRKAEFLNEKARLREKLTEIEAKGNCWLEPLENFVKAANQAEKTAFSDDLAALRDFFQRIGSNLFLFEPKADEGSPNDQTRTPSERAGQKSEPDARRGGLAARADLTTPKAASPILSASSLSKSLPDRAKVRPSGFFVVPSSDPENAAASAAARVSPVGGSSSPSRVTTRGNRSPRLRVEFPGPWGIWAGMDRKEK